MEETHGNVYTDLDSILDTRLSLLYLIDKDNLEEIVKNNSYFTRIKDEFGYISKKVFRYLYDKRDKVLLKNVYQTYILEAITDFFIEFKHNSLLSGGKGSVKLFLNVYPYILTSDEKEYFKNGIEAIVNDEMFEVEIIDKENIEPEWVSNNISIMFIYDGIKWIEKNISNKSLLTRPLTDVSMIVPRLVENDMIVKKKEIDGFFTDIEKDMGMFIKVNFINVEEFSIRKIKQKGI